MGEDLGLGVESIGPKIWEFPTLNFPEIAVSPIMRNLITSTIAILSGLVEPPPELMSGLYCFWMRSFFVEQDRKGYPQKGYA